MKFGLKQFKTVYNSLQQCTSVYNSLQQFTTVYNRLQQFTTVYNSLQQFTTVYNSLQQFRTVYNSLKHLLELIRTLKPKCRDGMDIYIYLRSLVLKEHRQSDANKTLFVFSLILNQTKKVKLVRVHLEVRVERLLWVPLLELEVKIEKN